MGLSIQFKNIQHIAFDLDGVLIDSISAMKVAWRYATQQVGINVTFDVFASQIGRPFKDILAVLNIETALHEKIMIDFNKVSISQLDSIKIYSGVDQAVRRAKAEGLFLSIVTSKNRERTNLIIGSLFSKYTFDAIVTPEDVSSRDGKPNPASLLLSCMKTGVDPSNTIYVGDMECDRQCAKRAGAHFLHARWGYGSPIVTGDIGFSYIADMMRFILDNR